MYFLSYYKQCTIDSAKNRALLNNLPLFTHQYIQTLLFVHTVLFGVNIQSFIWGKHSPYFIPFFFNFPNHNCWCKFKPTTRSAHLGCDTAMKNEFSRNFDWNDNKKNIIFKVVQPSSRVITYVH